MSLSAADLGDRFPAVTAHLGGREVEALAGALVPVEVVAGTTLIAEGGLADTLYFLARGELQVWIDVAKTPRPVSRLEPGSIVGEVALMDPGPASATVTAATRPPSTPFAATPSRRSPPASRTSAPPSSGRSAACWPSGCAPPTIASTPSSAPSRTRASRGRPRASTTG